MTPAPPMPSALSRRFGILLFRLRSFTPIPVLIVLAYVLFRTRGAPGPGGARVDLFLDIAGLLMCLLGQALRFYTLALVKEGTSGQGSVLEAQSLNTHGPYAFVRNPLYLGNLGICLGLMAIAHQPLVYAIGLSFFFFEYFFIIRAEEAFLREKFGERFDDFCRNVRRWVPRLSPHRAASPPSLRLDFDRAFKKEHNPFTAWATGAILLLGWEWAARGTMTRARLYALGALEFWVLALFLGIKARKHRWL